MLAFNSVHTDLTAAIAAASPNNKAEIVCQHHQQKGRTQQHQLQQEQYSTHISFLMWKSKALVRLLALRRKFFFTFLCCASIICFYQLMNFGCLWRERLFSSMDLAQGERCEPKNSIVFLKTHKTASSTVQNIFMRYAHTRGLLIAIPFTSNYLGHPEPFRRTMLPRLRPGYSYDIVCHHTRFNYPELQGVIKNATFITILRDPAHLFESLYSYYKLQKHTRLSFVDFALSDMHSQLQFGRRFTRKFGRNQMMFDLGLDEMDFENETSIKEYVSYLDDVFDLVMIAERMEESLVLLRHMLCWQPEDILFFKHNVRMHTKKRHLDPDVEEELRKWNSGDQILYDHFERRLSQRVSQFGEERMRREVETLKADVQRWYRWCIDSEVSSSSAEELPYKFKPFSDQVYGFKLQEEVNNSTCENLAKEELPYTQELRKHQAPYYRMRLKELNRALTKLDLEMT